MEISWFVGKFSWAGKEGVRKMDQGVTGKEEKARRKSEISRNRVKQKIKRLKSRLRKRVGREGGKRKERKY